MFILLRFARVGHDRFRDRFCRLLPIWRMRNSRKGKRALTGTYMTYRT